MGRMPTGSWPDTSVGIMKNEVTRPWAEGLPKPFLKRKSELTFHYKLPIFCPNNGEYLSVLTIHRMDVIDYVGGAAKLGNQNE